ncbi:MAG: universal stress protein [Parcubacteria group bacterium]
MKDILLYIDTYPDPTPDEAIDQAIALAAGLGATISALAVQVDIHAPNNRLAEYLIHLTNLTEEAEAQSLTSCRQKLAHFSEKAEEAGVMGEALTGRADMYLVAEYVATRARTRDLCIIPAFDTTDGQRALAEAAIFGSGRPVVTFRNNAALPAAGLGMVAVAWDGSRCAARALADALPLLAKAKSVRVVTVTGEKPSAVSGMGAEVVRHLTAHQIGAVVDDVDCKGRRIGPALVDHLDRIGADLLVMGAYGHSRVREFVLGGATAHMLHGLKIPLFLSH